LNIQIHRNQIRIHQNQLYMPQKFRNNINNWKRISRNRVLRVVRFQTLRIIQPKVLNTSTILFALNILTSRSLILSHGKLSYRILFN